MYHFYTGTGLFGNNQKPLGFGSTFSQPQASGTSTLFGSTNTGSIFGGTGTTTGSIFGQQQPTSQREFKLGYSWCNLA